MRASIFVFALGSMVAASALGAAAPAMADHPSVTVIRDGDGDGRHWRHRHRWHRPYYRPAPPAVVYYPPPPVYYPPPPVYYRPYTPPRPGFGFWIN